MTVRPAASPVPLEELRALDERYVIGTYRRQPVAFVRGEGSTLFDTEGRAYLDFVGGLAVASLGHSHPAVADAIAHQARTLVHVSNLYLNELQPRLAAELDALVGGAAGAHGRVFFANSGAEANECAIKLARRFGQAHGGPGRYHVVSAYGSFHGRTLAALAATGQSEKQEVFAPLPSGFRHVAYGDLGALAAAIDERVCAVLLEPVQGEGGVRYPSPGYLPGVRELCKKHAALLIYDEVQCGMGRTGKLFAYQHSGVAPDIMSLAKSLGAGLPIGACLATEEVAAAFQPGTHASTFGGNFLVCEAAKAFLRVLLEPGFLEKVRQTGAYLVERLRGLQKKYPFVKEVRGEGLMVGIELEIPGKPLVEAALQEGLVINAAQEKVLRLVPPLIVGNKEIDEAVDILDDVLAQASGGVPG